MGSTTHSPYSQHIASWLDACEQPPPGDDAIARQLDADADADADSKSPTESEWSRGSRRCASPIKHSGGLKSLAKPVRFRILPDQDDFSLLPLDVRHLYSRIRCLTELQTGFIPSAARGYVKKKRPTWSDHWFRPEAAEEQDVEELGSWAESDTELEGGKEVGRLLAQKQFRALRSIANAAKESAVENRGELAWNNLVHTPLLRRAASFPNSGVTCEPIMNASIASQWLPEVANKGSMSEVKQVASGKMVDYAVVLNLDNPRLADRALADAVIDAIGSGSVNQSTYGPLRQKPIGVSIETKVNTVAADGSLQLGIWTAAWHRRMSNLFLVPRGGIVTLPLLLCHGHLWFLYFACDRGSEIEVLGPISLGGTQTLPLTYSLFAALQEICRWVDGPFRRWLMTMLGVADPGESDSVAGTGG